MNGGAYIHFLCSPPFRPSFLGSTHASIHPSIQHMLSPYYMPGTVLGTRGAKTNDTPALGETKVTGKETR